MKSTKKIIIGLLIFIALSNTTQISNIYKIFFGPLIDVPFTFVTSDFKYCATAGKIENVLHSKEYSDFVSKNPDYDAKLYRYSPSRNLLRFWMWREYIWSKSWRTPSLDGTDKRELIMCDLK